MNSGPLSERMYSGGPRRMNRSVRASTTSMELSLAIDADHQRLLGELVDDVQRPIGPAIVGPVLDEVIGPDVVGPLRSQPDAGAVIEPEPGPFRLLLGDFQPFALPDPLHPLVVHMPARVTEHGRDPAVAVAAILAGQLDDVGGQPFLIVAAPWNLALGGAVLAERAADPALGLTLRVCRTRSIQCRRREGLSSFPS